MNLSELKAPFAPDRISWRLGSTNGEKTKGMALAYIDARDVMERLDAVCDLGWQAEYISMHNGTCCCRIGIRVGDEWVWRSNGALNLTDSDKNDAKEMAEKGSYSDAFKRAAVLWGIGRYLYDLDSPWVAIEAAGRSYKIASHEYARLEALLARGAPSSPKSAPQPQQAPQDADVRDGVANWLAKQKVVIAAATALPALYLWLDDVASLDGINASITDPDGQSQLGRCKRKEPATYKELVLYYQAKVEALSKS